jgi:hypothetical protein
VNTVFTVMTADIIQENYRNRSYIIRLLFTVLKHTNAEENTRNCESVWSFTGLYITTSLHISVNYYHKNEKHELVRKVKPKAANRL